MGHLRVTVGVGHLRLTIDYLKATVVQIRVSFGHLRVTIGLLRVTTYEESPPRCRILLEELSLHLFW